MHCGPQRDLAKIAKLELQTSLAPDANIHKANTAHPATRGLGNASFSSTPRTAIKGKEADVPHERGRKLSRAIFKWKRQVSRDSGDGNGSQTPVPVTAYKDAGQRKDGRLHGSTYSGSL